VSRSNGSNGLACFRETKKRSKDCWITYVAQPLSCYDNAAMEPFFWSLKHEWTNHERFANLEAARLSVFKYIETFYNPVRLYQTLGYVSPNQYEADNAPAVAA